jgi:hypothetical protein
MRFLAAALLLGATLITTSCGKYEDGPGFSLLTKKARLVGDWDRKSVTSGNFTIEDTDDEITTFEKDGTIKVSEDGVSYSGTWEFIDKKEKLRVSYTEGSFTFSDDYTIRRLTNKELWLMDDDENLSKFEAK